MRSSDGTVDLVESDAPDEEHLREVMRAHPLLIPVDDLGIAGPLLIVGRETILPSGRIDLLGLSRSGDVVIAEFKTGPQNSDFRRVLSQLIDYGSDVWKMPVSDFDQGVAQRYFRDSPDAVHAQDKSLAQIARDYWGLSDGEEAEFLSRLSLVLRDGDFDFVVVAQNFRDSVLTSADYLNATASAGRFHLVQLTMLAGGDVTAFTAQTVTSGRRRATKAASPQSVINEAQLLSDLEGDEYREAMREMFAAMRSLGVRTAWGSRGTSLRLDNPDRAEPISIGWLFPEGASWGGVKHFSLGYDTATAEATPSIKGPLTAYVDALRAIDGGTEITTKTVDGRMFTPDVAPQVLDELIQAVEQLVSSVSGLT